MRLKDKVAIITGGSRGIGYATADKFLGEGARVILTASSQASAEKAVERLKEKYPDLIDDVRGIGLMLAVEFKTSEIGYEVAKGMFARKVITAGTLVNAKCVRFEPAAVITEDQIAKVIERMDASLADTRAAMK